MGKVRLVVGLAVVCAGCALDDQLDNGDGDVSAVAKKSLPACKTKKKDKPKKNEKDCYTTTSVGSAGGVVEHPGGVTLNVPAGALDHDVAISVRDEGAPGPAGTAMYSPVFTFEPDGTQFARPVQVQFDVGTQTAATVYWTRATASGIVWDRIPAMVAGGVATSQITHFSSGGAGVPSDAFDLHIIQSVTWDRLDGQHIELTDFGAPGTATAYPSVGPPIDSEVWNDENGNPKQGEGMIRNIPAGEMWIRVGQGWTFTSLAATPVLDLSSEHFGTFGRATPDINQPHPITINVTSGAQTTSVDDSFELLVPDANAFYFAFPEDSGSPVVTPGITNPSFSWDLNSPPAVDNFITTDDVAYFAQMVPATTPPPASLPYKQMVKIGIATPADVPQTGGTLNVALGDLPANQTPRSYSIAASEYQSMAASPSPGATSYLSPPDGESSGWPTEVRLFNLFDLDVQSGYFDLQGEAGGRNVGLIGATADFAYMTIPGATMNTTFDTGPLSYGVPAGNWDIFAGLGGNQAFVVQLRCPVDATPCSTPGGWARQLPNHAVFVSWNDSRLVTSTSFAPTIGPARDLTIAGHDAQAFQSGVGTQPTISWNATTAVPTPPNRPLAAPQMYVVNVHHYKTVVVGGQWRTERERVASLKTPYTSVTIPAGLLSTGEVYSFVVRAVRRDPTLGISVLAEPNRNRYPAQDWTTASAPFMP